MKVKLKKMSLSPKEIEDGEDEMSEDKDSGSRDEVVVLQKNSRKITTAPGNKIRKKKVSQSHLLRYHHAGRGQVSKRQEDCQARGP